MQLPSGFNPYRKKGLPPSHEIFLAELDSIYTGFQFPLLKRIMRYNTSGGEYTEGLSELIDRIKIFRIENGFDVTIDINMITTLKGLPVNEIELDKCKMSLEAYHDKMCRLLGANALRPDIVKNKTNYFTTFEKICKKVLFQRTYIDITYDDAQVFFAYTLVQILEKLGVNHFEQNENGSITDIGNFALKHNVSTTDCYHSLINGKFIDASVARVVFDQIFREGAISNRVNWIGKSYELARFVFFLHTDIPERNHTAVCNDNVKKFQKAANCFTVDNNPVDPKKLSNSNRRHNEQRENLLLKAISHLQMPKKNTSKN